MSKGVLHLEIRTRGFDQTGSPLVHIASIGSVELDIEAINGSTNRQRGSIALQKVLNETQARIHDINVEPKGEAQLVNQRMLQELVNHIRDGRIDIEGVKIFTMRNKTKIMQIEFTKEQIR